MAVVEIQGSEVVTLLLDVKTVKEARAKYPHLANATLVASNRMPGTRYVSGRFSAPIIVPPKPQPESDVILAMRDLADAVGPAASAKLEARLGPRRIV